MATRADDERQRQQPVPQPQAPAREKGGFPLRACTRGVSSPTVLHRPSLPAPGEVVLGKYTIVRVVGEGAMGIVFEAVHLRLGQRVAIKMLLPSHGDPGEI